jgi:hypothetical protein
MQKKKDFGVKASNADRLDCGCRRQAFCGDLEKN